MTNWLIIGKWTLLSYFFFVSLLQCKRNKGKDSGFCLPSLITIVWIINDWCVNITIKLSFPTCFSNRTACNWCSIIIKADIDKHKHKQTSTSTDVTGVHFSFDVLLSWTNLGSCAHKCVSLKEKRLFLTSLKQTCNEYQSAPKLERRKTYPCSQRAPNLLHVLPSRMVGWNKYYNPVVLWSARLLKMMNLKTLWWCLYSVKHIKATYVVHS